MHKTNISAFLDGLVILTKFSQGLHSLFDVGGNFPFSVQEFAIRIPHAEAVIAGCDDLGLVYSKKMALRVLEELKKSAASKLGQLDAIETRTILVNVKNSIDHLFVRIKDETEDCPLVSIDAKYVGYYEPTAPLFGKEAFDAFPSANDDIDEAGKCLALGRGTACVMHLMRAGEVCLKALGAAITVGAQNDWGSYLREIEKELAKRAKTSGARTPDEQFYSEAATSFDHLKRAWRNPTMHVDRSYSQDRAYEIFQAVGSLMRLMATRIKE